MAKGRATSYKEFYDRAQPPQRPSTPSGRPNIGVPKNPNDDEPDRDVDPRKEAMKRRLAKTASGQRFVARTARSMKSRSMRRGSKS